MQPMPPSANLFRLASVISVITPVYNGDRFIASCIQAVIQQNCSPVEHLIIDGGSTDRTVAIIQQYAAQYPHIRWVSERDRGQSDAMNKGIALAKGDIIAILNVDDYYEPDVLNRVRRIFQTLPAPSLLVGNCRVWDTAGNCQFINQPRKLQFTDLLLGPKINPFPLNPSAYFYHKSLHDRIGFYSLKEHYTMDVDFLLRAVQVAQVQYVDQLWGNFRNIEGTKTIEDNRNGLSAKRIDRLMRHYRQFLPFPQRLSIAVIYTAHQIWERLQYFAQRPHEVLPKLRLRLLHRVRVNP
jgi:glycosyltransferase involved in cell wall biosynthesis